MRQRIWNAGGISETVLVGCGFLQVQMNGLLRRGGGLRTFGGPFFSNRSKLYFSLKSSICELWPKIFRSAKVRCSTQKFYLRTLALLKSAKFRKLEPAAFGGRAVALWIQSWNWMTGNTMWNCNFILETTYRKKRWPKQFTNEWFDWKVCDSFDFEPGTLHPDRSIPNI